MKTQWNDDARFNKFVKGLKALGVPVHKSTSAMFRLVISGEYAICMPALLHDVMEELHKGTPVSYVKTVPPVLFPRQAGIYVKAPNPNAAKLFAEWLISEEGQKTIDSIGRESSRNDFKSKTSIEGAFGKGTKPLPVTDKAVSRRSKEMAGYLCKTDLGRVARDFNFHIAGEGEHGDMLRFPGLFLLVFVFAAMSLMTPSLGYCRKAQVVC